MISSTRRRWATSLRTAAGVNITCCQKWVRTRWCRPTSRLSRTERFSNRARFWNVRAMPKRAASCTASVDTSRPSNITLPPWGR